MTDSKSGNPVPTKRKRLRGWRRIAFPLAALLLGLSPFVLLELILLATGAGKPTGHDDPFVGFSSVHPLFERNGDLYVTSLSRQLYFGRQRFAARKPKNGFRIFCLGGSTVRGRPHETDTAFCKWLEIELQASDPSRQFEAVNCGGVSYASYRLRPIVDEVLGYDPDLIVLATGHNEFLEDRTYQSLKSRSQAESWLTDRVYSLRTVTLARRMFYAPEDSDQTTLKAEVDTRLDQKSGFASYRREDAWWEGVLVHYRDSVRSVAAKCRNKKVPLILVSLGCNLRDCPPFKSEHKPGLTNQQKTQWQDAFDRATSATPKSFVLSDSTKSSLENALQLYRMAEAIDNEHALLLFRIARCLDRLGRQKEAGDYFRKAKEWDVCPLRMKKAMHEFLEKLANDRQIPLINARQLLRGASANAIPGFDCYVDHVHPTISSHQLIARALVSKMMSRKMLPASAKPWSERQRRLAYRNHLRSLPKTYLANSRQRIQWVENWARRQALHAETLPVDADGALRFGHRLLELGMTDEALEFYGDALTADPSLSVRLKAHCGDLDKQGRPHLAKSISEEFELKATGH